VEVLFSQWQTATHGLEATLDIRNLLLGLAVFFLSRTLAILYFINNIDDENIVLRARIKLLLNSVPFVAFFVAFIVAIFLSNGYAYGLDKVVYLDSYKYFMNFIQMPFAGILFLLGVLSVLAGITLTFLNPNFTNGIWFSGIGTILAVFSLFINLGFNHTAFYPSSYDLQSSISIENGSSSHYTLTAMSYVSLLVPFVAAYMWYAWKAINNKKIDAVEMSEESHIY
jgi:cytochrome d ubiquinol oxidase subunit II